MATDEINLDADGKNTPNPGPLSLVKIRSRATTSVGNWNMTVDSTGYPMLDPSPNDPTTSWRMYYRNTVTVNNTTRYTYVIQNVQTSRFLNIYWNSLLVRWQLIATGDSLDTATRWILYLAASNNVRMYCWTGRQADEGPKSGISDEPASFVDEQLWLGVDLDYHSVLLFKDLSVLKQYECDWDVLVI